MVDKLSSILCFTGVLLFVLGLATGFGMPAFRAPRIGLSAHLTATQCGIALIAFGILWPRLTLWNGWSAPLAHIMWISFYLLWVGLVAAAYWDTGNVLPIAGAGKAAAVWQDHIARVPIIIGSLGSFRAIGMLLVQWRWKAA